MFSDFKTAEGRIIGERKLLATFIDIYFMYSLRWNTEMETFNIYLKISESKIFLLEVWIIYFNKEDSNMKNML